MTVESSRPRTVFKWNSFFLSYYYLYASLDNGRKKGIALVGFGLAIAAGLPLPIIAIIYSKLISGFPLGEQDVQTKVVQLIGTAVAYFAVTALYVLLFGFTGEAISLSIRQRLLEALLRLDQAYHDTHEIDVHTLLTEKVDLIQSGCAEKVGILLQSVSYFASALIVSFLLDAKLAGILVSVVVPAMILIVLVSLLATSKVLSQITSGKEEANAIVESALRAVKLVQAFDMSKQICAGHEIQRDAVAKSSIRVAVMAATRYGCIIFVVYAINALAFYAGGHMASTDQQSNAGDIFAVALLIVDSSIVFASLAPYTETFAAAASASDLVRSLQEEAERHPEIDRIAPINHCSFVDRTISLKSVSFAYPARPELTIFSNLSITFIPGAMNAIVGPSGGGKSSVVSLLSGLYNFSGSVRVGLHELSMAQLAAMRPEIAVVEQEPTLFGGTIFENIACAVAGDEMTTNELEARCLAAARDAGIDFLYNLPHGLHTKVGDGLVLSGGQRQRVCLARALVRKPTLLLLDKPTSGLDAICESRVVNAVRRMADTSTTVIMIAHRLSTVRDADYIAVIAGGRLVEQGTYADLTAEQSLFSSMLEAQTSAPDPTPDSMVDLMQDSAPVEITEKDAFALSPLKQHPPLLETSDPDVGHAALLRRLCLFARPDTPWIFLGLAASAVSGAILVGEAIAFGSVIPVLDEVGRNAQRIQQVDFYCAVFLVLACVALVSYTASGASFGIASSRTILRLQVELLRRLLILDAEWYARPGRSIHDLMNAFTKTAGDLACLSGSALGTILVALTSLTGCIILAHVVAWKIAIVLLPAVPVMILAGLVRLRVVQRSEEQRRSAYQRATSLGAEACRSRKIVTIMGLERQILLQCYAALKVPHKSRLISTAWSSVILAVSLTVTYLVYALSYWWWVATFGNERCTRLTQNCRGSNLVRKDEYTARQYFIVMPAMLFSTQFTGQLFSLCPEVVRAAGAATSIYMLLCAQPTILQTSSTEIKTQRLSTPSPPNALLHGPTNTSIPKINFEGVSLAYSAGHAQPVLRDVTLAIPAGHTVALVGPSGAGKSSLISLVERFYDATTGQVKIDGVNIRAQDVNDVREKIGLVPQEPELFRGSLAYNVRLGASSHQTVSDDKVIQACKLCGLHDFVVSLPEGYETDCGSTSFSRLSGGQKQRLALARAIIRDPEILLLDEPTSALDAHSERQVRDTFFGAAAGRTTVIVAHRLATIKHVNSIYVFQGGTVVEHGTHEELIAKEGLYTSMAREQGAL